MSLLFLAPRLILSLSACATPPVALPEPESCSLAASGPFQPAPPESPRLDLPELTQGADSELASRFQGGNRLMVQVDRPMLRPGETVWVKTWELDTASLEGADAAGLDYELIDPRGSVVQKKKVKADSGTATNDFVIPAEAAGGLWRVRVTSRSGAVAEREVVVAAYEAPRLRKKLDFARDGYGPGDTVEALVELEGAVGGALALKPIKAMLVVDGAALAPQPFTTDSEGAVLVSLPIPTTVQRDVLLTVLVDAGGVTESITRSVPVLLKTVDLRLFPEGGDLVQGLPSRVYFAAEDRFGEPADVAGVVLDENGREVGGFESLHDGLGRFEFTPEHGHSYTAKVLRPAGLDASVALPAAKADGCVLNTYDDFEGVHPDLRVAVRCTTPQLVVVGASQREELVDSAAVMADADGATVYLHDEAVDRQGVARVTVFDATLRPLAERLVYRNPGRDLRVEITPDRESYAPGDEVVLAVQTFDWSGLPLAAELALSVVDDTVLKLADDKRGHILSKLFLESELVDEVEEPNWYFDPEESDARAGLDLLMGTKGWRRFETVLVQAGLPVVPEEWATKVVQAQGLVAEPAATMAPVQAAAMAPAPGKAPVAREVLAKEAVFAKDEEARVAAAAPMAGAAMSEVVADRDLVRAEKKRKSRADDEGMAVASAKASMPRPAMDMVAMDVADEHEQLAVLGYADDDLGGRGAGMMAPLEPELELLPPPLPRPLPAYRPRPAAPQWATVRVFPQPLADGDGVRDDFRDTVMWAPKVSTDKEGKGEVRFHLSDAVTTFRVVAEGAAEGVVGRGEATLQSVLPFSVSARIPSELSTGDRLLLPVTLDNRQHVEMGVALDGSFSGPIQVLESAARQLLLGADAGQSVFWLLEALDAKGEAKLRFAARGQGLEDVVERTLKVVPRGFPRDWSEAGKLDGEQSFTVTIDEAVEGTLVGELELHPGPSADLMSGLEGMLQTPGGCFEQTSSTNWPNVAILRYLDQSDAKVAFERRQVLAVGYERLRGYQVGSGGFETWGSGMGKEALSAYGLLQFRDMKKVLPVDAAILERDRAFLMAARDGSGGFVNTGSSAHGFGQGNKDVNDAFITFALVKSGEKDLGPELDRMAALAAQTKDPYVLAFATRALLVARPEAGRKALKRLVGMRAANGSFPGAATSIMSSYEQNLLVETTALATLAMLEGGHGDMHSSLDWLVKARQGNGTWGATQATVLALEVMTVAAEKARKTLKAGSVAVFVDGEPAGVLRWAAGASRGLELDFSKALTPGTHTITLRPTDGGEMPFTLSAAWRALTPASAPKAELALHTRLDRTQAKVGETLRLSVEVDNRADRVVTDPIARIGLPAGLVPQQWQLEQLVERGQVAFVETGAREVVLYWDGVKPGEKLTVDLDLVAEVPGVFTGAASSAWPYYDDTDKGWTEGLGVAVTP